MKQFPWRWGAPFPLLAWLLCGFGAQSSHTVDVPVIVTAAPDFAPLAGLRGGERFPRGAHLLLLKDGSGSQLVEGFAASADASVSFDGQRVLFAGKKMAADPWAIWELTLSSGYVRKVIGGSEDAVKPLYLPGDRLVYALRTQNGFRLETAGLDGSGVVALSYVPGNALPDDVLADGRILLESGFPLGSGEVPELFLVYSDGSGIESYRCDHGAGRWGGRQLASGDVVFTQGTRLARFTSALASEAPVLAARSEYAGEIAELPNGEWLLSARADVKARFALAIWKPGWAALRTVYARAGEDLVQAVPIAPRQRPNLHPSGLHEWDYANLLALDARQSREGELKEAPAMVRLETQDGSGGTAILGQAPVAADGSFFIQAPGNQPLRIALLNASGAVLRQERGWFWARGGEQRICIGCHTGPERASENRVPEVLLQSTTPVDLRGTHRQPNAEGR